MKNSKSNVVVLADYRNGNVVLDVANVKAFLETGREEIRKFDSEVYTLLRKKHTLKFVEGYHNRVLENEQALSIIADWLNDGVDGAEGIDKQAYERLLKKCGKLVERNERIKKNIVDDLASCRHYENKRELIKLVGFTLVTPVTVFNLLKALAPAHERLAWAAAIGGAALGTTVALQEQAGELISRTKRIIDNSPNQIKKLGKEARASFISATFSVSVAAKNINDVEPSIRPQEMRRPKIVCSANKI